VAIQVIAQMTMYLIYIFLCAPDSADFFKNNLIRARITIIAQINITRFPNPVLIISAAFPIVKTPINPIVITPKPTDNSMSIHNPTISSPNNATSMKAVGLAKHANAKKNHETMTYFNASTCRISPRS
jgi:hypothetical protein